MWRQGLLPSAAALGPVTAWNSGSWRALGFLTSVGVPHHESSLNRPAARPVCFMHSNSPQISHKRKERVAEGHLHGLSWERKSLH